MIDTIQKEGQGKILEMPMMNIYGDDKVERYLATKYDFRVNLVTTKPEYKLKGMSDNAFIEMEDYHFNSIWRELNNADIKCYKDKLRMLLNSDFCPSYDPFKEYIKSLPKWDGNTDYIEDLAQTVKTTTHEHWSWCLKKWIVAVVASLMVEKEVNHEIIVLSGKQGIGKTTWTKKLMPDRLGEKYFYSGTINPHNKDTFIYLAECMLINLDELDNLQGKELGSLKEVITKPSIKLRRPYGTFTSNYPHRASFFGSINDKLFLNDATGNRRYLCFETLEINMNHSVDMDKVYAQAYALFKDKFKYWFDGKDIQTIEKHNKQFEVLTVEEELLLRCFKPVSRDNADAFLTASEIIEELNEMSRKNHRLNPLRLGRRMKKHGYVQISKDNKKQYPVARIN